MNRYPTSASPKFRRFMIALYGISLMIYLFYLIDGASYYFTVLMERPRHPDYRILRPAGELGHTFGVLGTLMMLFMLLYSLRKRTRLFRNLGLLSRWLQVHIYFGIMGPLLIILHSSFKVQGLVAVSFWSMIAVALSGVLGRYIYIQIPRNISGKEIDLDELKKMSKQLTRNLQEVHSIGPEDINKISGLMTEDTTTEPHLLSSFWTLLYSDLTRPFRENIQRKFLKNELKLDAAATRQIMKIIREKELLNRRIARWQRIHELFHYWHVFHKPFAVIMYLVLLIHAGVAVYFGYTWIF